MPSSANTTRREERAARAELDREILARDEPAPPRAARAARASRVGRPPARDTPRAYAAGSSAPRAPRSRANRPRRMIAACVASASPSARLCVTSTSAAPGVAQLGRAAPVSARASRPRRGRVYGSSSSSDARRVHDRAGDRHALLQSAAQRAHRRVGAVGDAHAARARAARQPRGSGDAVQARRELDVLARGERVVQHARWRTSPTCARASAPARSETPSRHRSPWPGARAARRRAGAASSSPAPFGPNSARHSPAPSVKLTPSTARRPRTRARAPPPGGPASTSIGGRRA